VLQCAIWRFFWNYSNCHIASWQTNNRRYCNCFNKRLIRRIYKQPSNPTQQLCLLFRGEVVSGVTGGGNTKGWFIEGVIKRGANAASTALVGTPTVTSLYADAGAATWTIAVTADTTNGGLAVTFTGQAGTTIRTVCQVRTTEMTF